MVLHLWRVGRRVRRASGTKTRLPVIRYRLESTLHQTRSGMTTVTEWEDPPLASPPRATDRRRRTAKGPPRPSHLPASPGASRRSSKTTRGRSAPTRAANSLGLTARFLRGSLGDPREPWRPMRTIPLVCGVLQLAVLLLGAGACERTPGGFGVGNWPPASYRPYDLNAWINRVLPANPQVDPNSAAIVAAFDSTAAGWSDGRPEDKGVGLVNDYDHPIYWAKASDLVYTLTGCGYSGRLNGVTIHALKGMLAGGGSDAHVVVMDQATNTEYDFWQAVIDDNARTIGGGACGRLSIFGDGRVKGQTVSGPDGDGANAAITGLYAGQIRGAELVAGKIAHAIAINTKCTNNTHVYPATGNALSCGG